MSWVGDHVGMTGAAGGGTIALIGLAFKDVLKEWWRDYHSERELERQAKAQRNGGEARLANELLSILRQDLQESRAQLKDLNVVLNRIAGAMENLSSVLGDTHHLSKETRDWVLEMKGRPHQ